MKAKKPFIAIVILSIIAIASITGYLMVSMTPSTVDDDVTSEEIDGLLDDLENLDDIESELNIDEEDLDIDFE